MGGKLINLKKIPYNSTIISAGLGDDIEFEIKLIKEKKCFVVGIDSSEAAELAVNNAYLFNRIPKGKFIYIKKMLSASNTRKKVFLPNEGFMSSIISSHADVNVNKYIFSESITLEDLLKEYKNISYLKLDVEGSEYEILNEINIISNIPQISIEFHHYCIKEYNLEKTISLVKKFKELNYIALDYTQNAHKDKKLNKYVSNFDNLNCEFLFIK